MALIGILLLIGIVKKNAIMMIDFALQAEREQGLPPVEAIYQACLLRFRPIMMTTLAAMFGGLPLAIGMGVGSELRQAPRHHHRRRPARLAGSHSLHHARRLPLLRPTPVARHETAPHRLRTGRSARRLRKHAGKLVAGRYATDWLRMGYPPVLCTESLSSQQVARGSAAKVFFRLILAAESSQEIT